jgi:hypothetical protein
MGCDKKDVRMVEERFGKCPICDDRGYTCVGVGLYCTQVR